MGCRLMRAGLLASKFRNSGQTCVCANRVFVQAGVHDEFVAKLVEKTRALKLGNGMDAGVTQGPLINQAALKKVEGFVEDAKAKGATVATGGMRDQLGGTFFQPTVLTGVKADMEFAQEEIFGPVAPVFKFETDQDGIDMANNTRFGLAAYAYTSDLARAMRLDRDLQYGMVGINSGMITTVEAPFGGVKESGLGKEGGSQGVEDYLDTKYVCIDGL